MKKIYSIIYFATLVFGLSSCEKVVNINLNNTASVIVVDGQVTNSSTIGSIVKLSKTSKVNDDNTSVPLIGATVTIQEDNGTVYALPEVSNGVYKNASLVGVIGKKYHLKVITNGVALTSTSTMPLMVNLDSLVIEDFPNFGRTVKVVTPFYNDPIGFGNNYNLSIYKNGKLIKDAFAYDDLFIDGKKVTFPLMYSRERDEFNPDFSVDKNLSGWLKFGL